jgi:hypothetical protein
VPQNNTKELTKSVQPRSLTKERTGLLQVFFCWASDYPVASRNPITDVRLEEEERDQKTKRKEGRIGGMGECRLVAYAARSCRGLTRTSVAKNFRP